MIIGPHSSHDDCVQVLTESFLYNANDLQAYHELRELGFAPNKAFRTVAIARGQQVGCNSCPVMAEELRGHQADRDRARAALRAIGHRAGGR